MRKLAIKYPLKTLMAQTIAADLKHSGSVKVSLQDSEEIHLLHVPELAADHHGYPYLVLYPTAKPDSECDQEWVHDPRTAVNRVLWYCGKVCTAVESWEFEL